LKVYISLKDQLYRVSRSACGSSIVKYSLVTTQHSFFDICARNSIEDNVSTPLSCPPPILKAKKLKKDSDRACGLEQDHELEGLRKEEEALRGEMEPIRVVEERDVVCHPHESTFPFSYWAPLNCDVECT
jgi:hypothetical protein